MNKSEVKKIFYFLIFIFLFSCLPDVDYLIGIEHRALTHSITFSVFFSIILFTIWKIKRKTEFIVFILTYNLHIILDIFSGGVKLFYPFSDLYIKLQPELPYYFIFTLTKLNLMLITYVSYVMISLLILKILEKRVTNY